MIYIVAMVALLLGWTIFHKLEKGFAEQF